MQIGSTLHIPVIQDPTLKPPVQRPPLEDALTRQQQPSTEQSRPQRRVYETLSTEPSRNNPQQQLSKDEASSPRVRQALDSFTQIERFADDGLGTLLEGIDIRV